MPEIATCRGDFPVLSRVYDGPPLVYLDNAATTQKPTAVIDAVADFYRTTYANVHRSPHSIGAEATARYEAARERLAGFIGAGETAEVIFTRGTTEALNLIAGIFTLQLLQPGDVILTTLSEHHSNLIPWQMAAERSGARLEFVNLHGAGFFDLDEIRRNWNPKTRVFAFQHASNVLGTIHPAAELCRIAHEREALTVVDGAQAAPHLPVNVRELNCDFYALSAHKMLGPSGVGALYGRREHLERFEPLFGGGEMIKQVTLEGAQWNDPPFKFEAGTPNIEGVVGWGAALEYLEGIGMERVEHYVSELGTHAWDLLSGVEGVRVFGPREHRTGAVSFWVDGVHPHDLATIMDSEGVAVRAGHHCAEPLMRWLDVPATTRVSFYIYNTPREADMLPELIVKARRMMSNVA